MTNKKIFTYYSNKIDDVPRQHLNYSAEISISTEFNLYLLALWVFLTSSDKMILLSSFEIQTKIKQLTSSREKIIFRWNLK
jgi:hypothetical protein